MTKAVQSRGSTLATWALRRHSSCSAFLAFAFSSVSEDCRIRRSVTGSPSDSNCSSYFRPSLAVAAQEMLETCRVAMIPNCRHVPVEDSTSGTGRPSTFGRSLEFSSIRSTCSS